MSSLVVGPRVPPAERAVLLDPDPEPDPGRLLRCRARGARRAAVAVGVGASCGVAAALTAAAVSCAQSLAAHTVDPGELPDAVRVLWHGLTASLVVTVTLLILILSAGAGADVAWVVDAKLERRWRRRRDAERHRVMVAWRDDIVVLVGLSPDRWSVIHRMARHAAEVEQAVACDPDALADVRLQLWVAAHRLRIAQALEDTLAEADVAADDGTADAVDRRIRLARAEQRRRDHDRAAHRVADDLARRRRAVREREHDRDLDERLRSA